MIRNGHTLLLVAALLCTWPVQAFEGPSAELGSRLFHSAELGGNGRSCADCHAGGKGLEGIDEYEDELLAEIINDCISEALAGEALGTESQEMAALVAYLRTL